MTKFSVDCNKSADSTTARPPARDAKDALPAVATDQIPDVVRKLEHAYDQVRSGLLDRIESERKLGEIFQRAKTEVIPGSGLNISQWTKKYLPFTHQFGNRCAHLAVHFDSFKRAHDWYTQSGLAHGWRTRKATGVDYAIDVIALHKRSLRGEMPDSDSDEVKKLSPRERLEGLEKDLSDTRQRERFLFEALKRVYHLYRGTPEGSNYIDVTVHDAIMQPSPSAGNGAARPHSDTLFEQPAIVPTVPQSATKQRTIAVENKLFTSDV